MNKISSHDLGWGDGLAPLGTVEHAKRWRLDMQAAVDDFEISPDSVVAVKKIGDICKAWTLLKNHEGVNFKTFDEFCEDPRPHGLGTKATKIRLALELAKGKRAVQLETVAPPRQGERRDLTSGSECPKSEDRTAKSLRAILRAPEYIQDLYKSDLISQKTAAKLGPKRPTPDQSKRITETVESIRKEIGPKVKTDKDKVAVRKQVDKRVKTMFAPESKPNILDPVIRVVSAIEKEIAKLSDDDKARIAPELHRIASTLERE